MRTSGMAADTHVASLACLVGSSGQLVAEMMLR